MSHSIAQRLRVAILPFAAIVVVACGGGAAATQGTDSTGGSEPAATSSEDGRRLVAGAGRCPLVLHVRPDR